MSFAQDILTNRKAVATLEYSRSARSDVRFYLLTGIGLVFVYGGFAIDPASNCSDGGECAPWLVHGAFWLGLCAALAGIANLWRNPRWGSRVDDETRALIWWNDSLAREPQQIALDDIATIRIESGTDATRVSLHRADGTRLYFPREDVIPWPYRDWAETLASHYPHITVETTA